MSHASASPDSETGHRGLPDPPRFDLWPEALRSAERLRGVLVPCGPGVRGIGWPETPRVRLAALAPWLPHRELPAFITAAWVWGAARDPGWPLRITMPPRSRARVLGSPEVRVHELVLRPGDTATFGPFSVTAPLRTAVDLIHDPTPLGVAEAVAVRLLLPLIPGGAAALLARIESTRRPHRALALARMAQLRREA